VSLSCNYWNEIRWDGCPDCLSEDTDNIVVDVGNDEVKLRVCNECGGHFVNKEDIIQKPHASEKHADCVDELEPVIGHNNGDGCQLNRCTACGYYATDNDR
jgi:NMD protein affecting ribosome stability and mRNA decay